MPALAQEDSRRLKRQAPEHATATDRRATALARPPPSLRARLLRGGEEVGRSDAARLSEIPDAVRASELVPCSKRLIVGRLTPLAAASWSCVRPAAFRASAMADPSARRRTSRSSNCAGVKRFGPMGTGPVSHVMRHHSPSPVSSARP